MAEWKTIEELFDLEKGSLQSSKCIPGDYPFITAAEEWKSHESYTHDCEALIFAMAASGSLGRTHYVKGKFMASDLCFIITPKIGLKLDLLFYYRLFNFLRRDIVKKTASGTSKLSINRTNFGSYKLPYFDYEHQINFRGEIETLATINDECFVKIHDQVNLINNLRQQVLQEAVEGKLTAEWRREHHELISGDNHPGELLERITVEKTHLINEGKLRRAQGISNSKTMRELNIPDNWVWAKGDDIFFVTKLAGFEYTKYFHLRDIGEVPVIRAQNVRPIKISKDSVLFMDLETSRLLERSALIRPCLLVTFIGAGIGDVSLFEENARWHLAPNVAKMELFADNACLNLRYLNYFLLSESGKKEIFKHVKATAQPSLSMGTIRDIDYPIPSLQEQRAIVEKLDRLVEMIDGLEEQVSKRKEKTEMLMQSVLRGAFATN